MNNKKKKKKRSERREEGEEEKEEERAAKEEIGWNLGEVIYTQCVDSETERIRLPSRLIGVDR